jgi:hypothetical protein
MLVLFADMGPSWSYDRWIYNYQCNQYLSPLKLWVRIPCRLGVLDTTLCDKVYQWLTAGLWLWFSPGTLVSSTNKADCHNITDILLKVVLNTINQTIILLGKVHVNACTHCLLLFLAMVKCETQKYHTVWTVTNIQSKNGRLMPLPHIFFSNFSEMYFDLENSTDE